MSPTVLRYKNYSFLFFSREESRPHVHVSSAEGEAKFWLTPEVSMAGNYGFNIKQIHEIENKVRAHQEELLYAWRNYFKC